ncbi:hypothetical protein T4E_7165, partial [Trichinella pseudospiralis]
MNGGCPEKTSGNLDSSGQPSSPGEKRVTGHPGPYKCDRHSFTTNSTWLFTELHFKSVHDLCQFAFVCSKCSKEWPSINSVPSHYARCKGRVVPVSIPFTSKNTCSSSGVSFDTKNGLHCNAKELIQLLFWKLGIKKRKPAA